MIILFKLYLQLIYIHRIRKTGKIRRRIKTKERKTIRIRSIRKIRKARTGIKTMKKTKSKALLIAT